MKGLLSLRTAAIGIAAVLASFAVTYTLCVRSGMNASPAVLSAALAVGLMRRPEPLSLRKLVAKIALLPLVALAASFVGMALLRLPPLGAALFCTGIGASIWLRRYGASARAIGRVIALPFIAILVVPVRIDPGSNQLTAILLLLAAGAVALVVSAIAARMFYRHGESRSEVVPPRAPRAADDRRMEPSTRMALQMLVALALAFAIGMTVLPAHWFWVVLSAFIVCSGSVARGDAVYKAILRVSGAVAGTAAAALFSMLALPSAPASALAFFVLFVGMWLREINYAYWAACATLLFALLQGSHTAFAGSLFATRVLGIVLGAACAVASTWFVYPIRTRQLMRRRLADALAALRTSEEHELRDHRAKLSTLAPPLRLHRALSFRHDPQNHPATWVERTLRLLEGVLSARVDRAHIGAEAREIGTFLKKRE